ncbi:lipid-A-disaccharide synthase [bacterium]|nr:lipid-A-disaccharide synthase [bacterium]
MNLSSKPITATDTPFRICILAGEASGDLHAAELLEALKKLHPNLEIFGMGGDKMQALGTELLFHVRDLSILGFLEVVKHLPFIRRVYRTLKSEITARKPDLIVFVDYPGFNLRFAKTIRNLDIPTCYYISPQVWAWGKKRIRQMARLVDKLLVILPFEKEVYANTDLDVQFVGHPLKDVVHATCDKDTFCSLNGLNPDNPVIALLPGSRLQELQALLPEMTEAALILKKDRANLQICIGRAPNLDKELYTPHLAAGMTLLTDQTYDLMAHSDIALVASGTATLETAILETPMIICYKMASLSYFIGRFLVKIKHIGLANIVAGRTIVPELIQHEATASRMAEEAAIIMDNIQKRNEIIEGLKIISVKLGQPGASERAAKAVSELLAEK